MLMRHLVEAERIGRFYSCTVTWTPAKLLGRLVAVLLREVFVALDAHTRVLGERPEEI